MKLEQHIDKDGKKYWLATGEGDMRPIACEAHTREGARQAFMETFGQQYAEMEAHSSLAVAYMISLED